LEVVPGWQRKIEATLAAGSLLKLSGLERQYLVNGVAFTARGPLTV
jgi:hypothetical protein